MTNKDLFYSDVRNYYNQQIDDEDERSKSKIFLGPVENIQRHYISSVLALKKIEGAEISKEDEEKYLDDSFFTNFQYLGRSMLDVEKVRSKTGELQKKFDALNCYKTMHDDLN